VRRTALALAQNSAFPRNLQKTSGYLLDISICRENLSIDMIGSTTVIHTSHPPEISSYKERPGSYLHSAT
jgi:hypothetical protein